MKQQKLLMPWQTARGKLPVAAAAFDCIAPFCATMIVVVGRNENEIIQMLGDRKFTTVTTTDEVEMFASITAGLRAIDQLHEARVAMLHPADHPHVRDQTVEELFQINQERPGAAIMPTHADRGGHPVLIPRALFRRILHFTGAGGLRQFWIDHPETCVRVPVDDPGVILDIDTPEDYQRGMTVPN
jgi:CTP:molybdopterin cytidylyltransferase MocA